MRFYYARIPSVSPPRSPPAPQGLGRPTRLVQTVTRIRRLPGAAISRAGLCSLFEIPPGSAAGAAPRAAARPREAFPRTCLGSSSPEMRPRSER